jgi:hypothetical protein
MNLKTVLIVLIYLLCNSTIFCQKIENDSIESDSTDIEKKSYFTSSITYSSNTVTVGRADNNLISPSTGVSVGYNFKSGIYITAETGILLTKDTTTITAKPSIFGGLSLQGGYGFSLVEDLLSADINYTHYLFQNTTKISSEIQGTASVNLSLDLGWLGADLVTNYSYGNANSDILFNFSINKNINLFPIGKDSLNITPTLSAYAGTQNLFGLHLRKIPLKTKNAKLIAAIKAQDAILIADAKQFKYLDLDLELPISYTINAFTFELTPTLSLPSNLIEPAKVNYFAKNPFFINFSVSIKV